MTTELGCANVGAMAEPEITHSPLEMKVTRDGITVEIFIYRDEDAGGWILEVLDQKGGSTIWDDPFATDREAHDEAMRAIEQEGIGSFAEEGIDLRPDRGGAEL